MVRRYSAYTMYTSRGVVHPYRESLLGATRSLFSGLRDIPLLLLILKLCNVISISFLAIAAIYIGYHVADLAFDFLFTAIDRADERRRAEEYRKGVEENGRIYE